MSAAGNEALVWMPFRFWDRYRDGASAPEASFFQATFDRGPVFWRSFGWNEDFTEELVKVRAVVRFDNRGDYKDKAGETVFVRRFEEGRAAGDALHSLDFAASRMQVRFGVEYGNGAFDPINFLSHAWKRSPELKAVMIDYEGETRILEEEVSTR